MFSSKKDEGCTPLNISVVGMGCIGAFVGGRIALALEEREKALVIATARTGATKPPSPRVHFLFSSSSRGRKLLDKVDACGGFQVQEGAKVPTLVRASENKQPAPEDSLRPWPSLRQSPGGQDPIKEEEEEEEEEEIEIGGSSVDGGDTLLKSGSGGGKGVCVFTSDPAQVLGSAVDLVLVATKRGANQDVNALLRNHPSLRDGTPVLLLQNGLDAAADFSGKANDDGGGSGGGGSSVGADNKQEGGKSKGKSAGSGQRLAVFQCIVTFNVVSVADDETGDAGRGGGRTGEGVGNTSSSPQAHAQATEGSLHAEAPPCFKRTSPRPKLTLDQGAEDAFAAMRKERKKGNGGVTNSSSSEGEEAKEEGGGESLASLLRAAGFSVSLLSAEAMGDAQRGKLVVNLFNAPNALSGLPTSHCLAHCRGCCALTAACMREAIATFDKAHLGISPSAVRVLPAVFDTLAHPLVNFAVAALLVLATALHTLVFSFVCEGARAAANTFLGKATPAQNRDNNKQRQQQQQQQQQQAKAAPWHLKLLDASAHSSMFEDLQNRRPTEVAYLNGAVVALGERLSFATTSSTTTSITTTPVNRSVLDSVRAFEAAKIAPCMSSRELKSLIV